MPRLVRHRRPTLLSRFKDLLLAVHEWYETIDLDDFSKVWVAPLGLVFNLVYWLCCYSCQSASHATQAVFEGRGQSERRSTQAITRMATFILVAMILASIGNAYFLFTRRRTYQLRPQAAGSSTPDALPSASSPTELLDAWEPSLPSLRFFCVLSPVHLLITWHLCQSPYTLVVLLSLSASQLFLAHLFMQHVRDKKILYGHVFSEYERNFVEPRLSIMKRDVGCGTSPDEQGVYVEVHTPKVGILDTRKQRDIPRSASLVRMHDWDKSTADMAPTPVRWRPSTADTNAGHLADLSSPFKQDLARRRLQTPAARSRSPMKPAGWRSTYDGAGSPMKLFAGEAGLQEGEGMKRSRTMPSLLKEQ